MKCAFVFRQTFRRTTVVHFNEIKLVKEDDIEDKERLVEKHRCKGGGGHLKRPNPDKRLLESLLPRNI